MLLLSRKPGEIICIGDDIEVHVVAVQGQQVRVGIDAPKSVHIVRKEIQGREPNPPADADTFEPGAV